VLHVTVDARDLIHETVEECGIPVRLETVEDGGFRLRPSAWKSGDMSYAHSGSAILLVEGELARRLEDRALDVRSEDELHVRSRKRPRPPPTAAGRRRAADPVELVGV